MFGWKVGIDRECELVRCENREEDKKKVPDTFNFPLDFASLSSVAEERFVEGVKGAF